VDKELILEILRRNTFSVEINGEITPVISNTALLEVEDYFNMKGEGNVRAIS